MGALMAIIIGCQLNNVLLSAFQSVVYQQASKALICRTGLFLKTPLISYSLVAMNYSYFITRK